MQAIAPYNPLAAMPFAAGNVLSRMLSVMPGPWMSSHGTFNPAPYAAQQVTAAPVEAPAAELLSPPPPPPADAASLESLRRELDELKRSLRGGAANGAPDPAARKRPAAREGASSKASTRRKP